MTGQGDDHKKKSDEAARFLAESFFGINMNPADLGGEVLFDDYDDVRDSASAPDAGSQSAAATTSGDHQLEVTPMASAAKDSVISDLEDDLDDLIVFSDDEDLDDEDDKLDSPVDDEDVENFDFGEEEEEIFDDEDGEDEDEDDEEEDLDDDFGADIDAMPGHRKPVVAQEKASRIEPRAPRREKDRGRTPSRDDRGERKSQTGEASKESARPASHAPSSSGRGDKKPAATRSGDDEDYWQELDEWVWEESRPTAPAGDVARAESPDVDLDDEADDDLVSVDSAESEISDRGEEDSAGNRKSRRGRRRGGRGRGRRRRDETDESRGGEDERSGSRAEDEDDLTEILFEEDQEDIVSVSAASQRAQRKLRDEPVSVDEDDEDDEDEIEPVFEEPRSGRDRDRGRSGRGRGRGRGERTDAPAHGRPDRPAPARRPVSDRRDDIPADDIDDADDELIGFDDEPRGRPAQKPKTDAGARSDRDRERRPISDERRGRDAEPRRQRSESPAAERGTPRRGRSESDTRGDREQRSGRDGGAQRSERGTREAAASERSHRSSERPGRRQRSTSEDIAVEPDERREPRSQKGTADYRDVPTWEDAIGALSLRTPSEDHARRTENRSRGPRDGGRPPRRR